MCTETHKKPISNIIFDRHSEGKYESSLTIELPWNRVNHNISVFTIFNCNFAAQGHQSFRTLQRPKRSRVSHTGYKYITFLPFK